MNESLFIGAYWSSRKESRQECAERIATFLRSIESHAGLDRWFLKARSRKAAMMPLELTIEAIGERLKTNSQDTDGTPIQELGFNLNVWNGSDANPASLVITCGVFSSFVKNSAVLYLPPQPPPTDAHSCETFRALLEKCVKAWDPDDALVTSTQFLNRKGGGMPWVTGGWATYRRGQCIELHSS